MLFAKHIGSRGRARQGCQAGIGLLQFKLTHYPAPAVRGGRVRMVSNFLRRNRGWRAFSCWL